MTGGLEGTYSGAATLERVAGQPTSLVWLTSDEGLRVVLVLPRDLEAGVTHTVGVWSDSEEAPAGRAQGALWASGSEVVWRSGSGEITVTREGDYGVSGRLRIVLSAPGGDVPTILAGYFDATSAP